MGGDGGSIPRRCEMVKEKKEPEKKNKDQDMVGKWQHCALSGQALMKPIMACRLGRLYNKEAVINHILDKSSKSHIKKLADVSELKLTDNPNYKGEIHADSYIDHYTAPFVCPIIGLEMSGKYRFLFNWVCKCVMSEKATIEVPSEKCHHCGGPIERDNIIVINGAEDDVAELSDRIVRLKEKTKLEKRNRREDESQKEKSVKNIEGNKMKHKKPRSGDSTDYVTSKKTKISSSSAVKFEESASYKKLFHKNGSNKEKAHWVTYNPYYN